jgi:hypothetical protein
MKDIGESVDSQTVALLKENNSRAYRGHKKLERIKRRKYFKKNIQKGFYKIGYYLMFGDISRIKNN